MRFLKKAAALIVAAALALGCSAAAYAESSEQDSSGSGYEESGYTPIDTAGYTRWTGSEELRTGTNYYIDSAVKISKGKTVTLPAGSRMVLRSGADLQIYVGGSFRLYGEMLIEPDSQVTASGTFSEAAGSSLDVYGKFSSTKSSTVKISSEFAAKDGSTVVFGGKVYVYRTGVYSGANRTTLAADSDVKITGKWIVPEGAKLFIKGAFSVTISGEVEQYGTLYLYSRIVNSGRYTLAYKSEYYKTVSAVFGVTKSGIVTDQRGLYPPEDSGGSGEDNDSGLEEVEWKGIDISRYQGAIDWNAVKRSGIDFAFIRASVGDGSTDRSGEDVMFRRNVTMALDAGLKVGAYHYLWAETVEDARVEARFFIKTIEPYNLNFPVVLDFEDPTQEKLGKSQLTAIAKAFMEELKAAGYYPMLYANKNWLINYFDMNQLSDYEIWLAEWRSSPTYSGDFGIWQYSSKGRVSGIDGDVDLNICYRNYSKFITEGGYNNIK